MSEETRLFPSTCPLDCPDACGILAEVDEEERLVGLRGNPRHSWSRGHLCSKTAIAHELVQAPNRLSVPLVRRGGELAVASWDEALDRVAEGLEGLAGEDLLALAYAGNMGQVARGFPMRVMNHLGAARTDGGLCDSAAEAGYRAIYGDIVGPDPEDADQADVLIVWGCDARRTHQHVMPRMREVLRRGGEVLVIDIYETDTMRQVRSWGGRGLVIAPGSDAALALELTRLCFERGHADLDFLESECVGGDELRAHVRDLGSEGALAETGLSRDELELLYGLLTGAEKLFMKLGVGWTRRRYGASGMRAVCALAAVLGRADWLHFQSSDHFDLDADSIRQPERIPAGATPPVIRHVELGAELEAGRFRAALVWGHNPAMTVPDSVRVRAGLQREDLFLVVHELFLTETARLADVVLPAAAWIETSDVYRSYGHRTLHWARRASRVPGEQRSNVETFRAIAQRLGLPEELWQVTEDELCRELLAENRARFTADEYQRLLAGEPVKLAPVHRSGRGTPSGKIELLSAVARGAGEPELPVQREDPGTTRGAFWFMAAPSVATHNTTYGQVSRHARRAGRARVHVAPEDARRLGVEEGARVRLANELGRVELPATVDDRMPRGMLRVDGLPPSDQLGGIGLNALSAGVVSDLGDGNVLHSTRCDLELA